MDRAGQMGVRQFQQQMIMVGHQDIRVEPHAKQAHHFLQQLEKTTAVLVIAEDVAPLVATGRHMTPPAGAFDSQSSRHAGQRVMPPRPPSNE
jgi:hypothetical protein